MHRPGKKLPFVGYLSIVLFIVILVMPALGQDGSWNFAVSGDSRNCGDVVMPAIAAGAKQNHAQFYWHLGDLRAIFAPDEDYQHEPEHRGQPPDLNQYLSVAWDDFLQNQFSFFADMPAYVGIGNHETIQPKTREEFIAKFEHWLDYPRLKKQRLADDPNDKTVHSFYHWIQDSVDFLYLDNATPDQFDATQLAWFESVLERARKNPAVRTVVVGMHESLPDSLASGHSMSDSATGTESGRRVYTDLLKLNRATKKRVYILASHSHFYMSGIFNSNYWNAKGGVLPGWIVGTAGAMRYPLPPTANKAKEAREKVYGYLLGKVHRSGSIDFSFKKTNRSEIPAAVAERYTPAFADYCFNENTDFKSRPAQAGR
ncbi:MAG TPA: hypothetical protein VI636_00370 [Candidatus Angelobacter sp.]